MKKGELRIAASGVSVTLSYGGGGDGVVALEGGGTKIELKQDGDLTITAAGRRNLRGTEIRMEANGPVRINGATLELN